MRKGELNRDKFKELIENKGFSMRDLSLKAGMAESYCKDLASGKIKSPTIEKFIKLTNTLNVYPDDLIPLDWQKPSADNLDEQILFDVICGVTRLYSACKDSNNLDMKWFCKMIVAAYKNYTQPGIDRKAVNDNIVYNWAMGKLQHS